MPACVSSVKTCVSKEISRSLRKITVHITVHNKTNALYRLSIYPVRGKRKRWEGSIAPVVPKFRRRQKPTLARQNTCKRDQLFFRHHTFSSNSQNHCQTLCEVQMSARTHLLVNSQTWVGSSIKKRHFQALS